MKLWGIERDGEEETRRSTEFVEAHAEILIVATFTWARFPFPRINARLVSSRVGAADAPYGGAPPTPHSPGVASR